MPHKFHLYLNGLITLVSIIIDSHEVNMQNLTVTGIEHQGNEFVVFHATKLKLGLKTI